MLLLQVQPDAFKAILKYLYTGKFLILSPFLCRNKEIGNLLIQSKISTHTLLTKFAIVKQRFEFDVILNHWHQRAPVFSHVVCVIQRSRSTLLCAHRDLQHFKHHAFYWGLRSNKVTATELTHVKWINKYLLFRPHISVEYNNISWCSEEDTSRIH